MLLMDHKPLTYVLRAMKPHNGPHMEWELSQMSYMAEFTTDMSVGRTMLLQPPFFAAH